MDYIDVALDPEEFLYQYDRGISIIRDARKSKYQSDEELLQHIISEDKKEPTSVVEENTESRVENNDDVDNTDIFKDFEVSPDELIEDDDSEEFDEDSDSEEHIVDDEYNEELEDDFEELEDTDDTIDNSENEDTIDDYEDEDIEDEDDFEESEDDLEESEDDIDDYEDEDIEDEDDFEESEDEIIEDDDDFEESEDDFEESEDEIIEDEDDFEESEDEIIEDEDDFEESEDDLVTVKSSTKVSNSSKESHSSCKPLHGESDPWDNIDDIAEGVVSDSSVHKKIRDGDELSKENIKKHSTKTSESAPTSIINSDKGIIYEKNMSLVEFLRKNKSIRKVDDVLKYYTLKDINEAVKKGRVMKKKNKLFI